MSLRDQAGGGCTRGLAHSTSPVSKAGHGEREAGLHCGCTVPQAGRDMLLVTAPVVSRLAEAGKMG